MSISATVIVAIPWEAIKLGALATTSRSNSLSCVCISLCRISQRLARARIAALADAVVDVILPGLNAAM
jgi:hypothetical protein